MKIKIIQNQYDGPRAPTKRLFAEQINMDFANSVDAAEIDAGIRECIRGLRMSILAMGLGLAKLKAKELYNDLQFHRMNDYVKSLCEQMHVNRSTIHNWIYVGEAYIKYRRELERIEFTYADGPTKLPYLERALGIYEKQEVFRNVKSMTLEKFKEYALGESSPTPPSKIQVVGNKIFVWKKLAVTLAEELDPKTKGYFEKIDVQAGCMIWVNSGDLSARRNG